MKTLLAVLTFLAVSGCAAPFAFAPATSKASFSRGEAGRLRVCLADHATQGGKARCYDASANACEARGYGAQCASTELYWDCMARWERAAHLADPYAAMDAMPEGCS